MSQTAVSKKVFVGMSGGVDSSVSAALLKEQGFDVTGVFIKVWSPEWLQCDWKEERRDAMRVAAHLNIPFLTLDLEARYKKGVADYMIEEYRKGRTPNPDVMCNREIKFGAFLKFALENGADFVATGHYSQVKSEKLNAKNGEKEEIYKLYEGKDKNKDQSYFLWTLTQNQLKHVLFPVGHFEKPEVRKLAEKFGLPTAVKKDSQGICFLGDVDMKEFLSHYIEPKNGNVLDEHGKIIGTHEGAIFLTLGQRHGFTVTKKTPTNPKLFVVAKDAVKNTIIVSHDKGGEKHQYEITEVQLENPSFTSSKFELNLGQNLHARFRYHQTPLSGSLRIKDGKYYFSFAEPQTAISPGQSLVLFCGEECIGGGIIKETVVI